MHIRSKGGEMWVPPEQKLNLKPQSIYFFKGSINEAEDQAKTDGGFTERCKGRGQGGKKTRIVQYN